jgi:antagonist of KipI
MNVLVQAAGFLTSVQDLGRRGFRQAGVSLGGALDSHALRVANAVVGNDDHAAGLELTLGKVRLGFRDRRLVAWCGGAAFAVRVNEKELPPGHAGLVENDAELAVDAPTNGARAWLAVSGGLDVPVVLGSRATDLRGNFGGFEGRALRDGDLLPLGAPERRRLQCGGSWVSDWAAPANWAATASQDAVLRVVRGPDWDRFSAEAQRSLLSAPFSVTPESDRMGAQLEGAELKRDEENDLLSEAVVPGTLQVPPNGQPILLLADCQTIGGYPKIAHVITVDLPIAAQLGPGRAVRFQEVPVAAARDLLRQREEDFARFRVGLQLHRS